MSAGTILLAGALAQKPREGGHTWVFLQYLLGFRRLGWDVLFIDRLDTSMCRDADGKPCGIDASENLRYFVQVMNDYGLADFFSLICDGGERTIGVPRDRIIERARTSACLINVMGFLGDAEIMAATPRKVFLDIDPGFGQMWCELGLHNPFLGHDLHVTIGENLGRPGCAVPTCGINWITTPQPIVLEQWPAHAPSGGRFTSIGAWRGPYGPVEFRGETYGLRVHEFRRFIEMPSLSGCEFEVALDIDAAEERDLRLLRENDWRLINPREVAATPQAYQRYIRDSRGEFLVAKNMYVKAKSGWMSDRSICYLASGRPVVAQDTGLGERYRRERGLLLYSTVEEAVDAVRRVESDPTAHSRAARALAEELFDSDKVLRRLLNKLGIE